VIEDEDDEMDVDGLLGFRRSAQRLAPTKWYPPPEVPSDYRPFHYFQTSLYTDGPNFPPLPSPLPSSSDMDICAGQSNIRCAGASNECRETRRGVGGDTPADPPHGADGTQRLCL